MDDLWVVARVVWKAVHLVPVKVDALVARKVHVKAVKWDEMPDVSMVDRKEDALVVSLVVPMVAEKVVMSEYEMVGKRADSLVLDLGDA